MVFSFGDGKFIDVISLQAGINDYKWCKSVSRGSLETIIADAKRGRSRAAECRSKLEAWAERVKPQGDYLRVARIMYRSYVAEVQRQQEIIDRYGPYQTGE